MDRRRYLALLGAAAATAGCSGGDDGTTTTDAETATETATDTATEAPTAEPTPDAPTAEPTPTETETRTDAETEPGTEEPITLTVAAAPVDPGDVDAINNALHAAGLREAVALELRETSTNSLRQRTRRWTSGGGSAPDLVVTEADWTRSLLRDGLGVRLDTRFSSTATARIRSSYDRTLSTVTDDAGAVRAVPLGVSVPTILYRRDRFEQGGHAPGEERATTPMTWRAFASAVGDVRDRTGVGLGFGFAAEQRGELAGQLFNEVLTSWGGAYFGTPDALVEPSGGRSVTIGEEPARNALRMLRTFVYEDDRQGLPDYESEISSPEVLDWRADGPRAAMASGDAAAIRAGPSALATWARAARSGPIWARCRCPTPSIPRTRDRRGPADRRPRWAAGTSSSTRGRTTCAPPSRPPRR